MVAVRLRRRATRNPRPAGPATTNRTEEARDDAHRFQAAPSIAGGPASPRSPSGSPVLALAVPIASAGGRSRRWRIAARRQPPSIAGTAFYVPKPNHGAIEQIAALTAAGQHGDADLIRGMIETPQAVWFTLGTPAEVERSVRATVKRAAAKGTTPVLVAYNIPFRDCAQFSAGGATSATEYDAWIDGFAAASAQHRPSSFSSRTAWGSSPGTTRSPIATRGSPTPTTSGASRPKPTRRPLRRIASRC